MRIISKAISAVTGQLCGSSLKARSARGATVLGVGVAGGQTLRLVRNMILTRILAPDAFGMMAMVIAASAVFQTLTDVGIKQSVIQNKRGAEPDYLNVVWWLQSLRGAGLYVIAFLAAPWISQFYDMPELLSLLRVAFLVMIFDGFVSPRIYVLEKKFQFGRFVFLTQGTGLLSTLLTICLVFYLQNVWALVIGLVAESVMCCLLSFVLCPFLPRMSIDRNSLRDVLQYARRMFGVPILAVIAFQLDVLVLGKVVSSEKVGAYWLALQLALQMGALFDRVVYPILLPIFAEKQDHKQSLRRTATKITAWTAVFGIPITTFLVACANPILSIVYGLKYGIAAIPFSLLCIYVLLRTQGSILSQIYFAVGKPNLHRRFVTLRLVILACFIYPGIVLFGVVGAATVVVLANLIGLCMQVIWTRKIIGLQFGEYVLCWIPSMWLMTIVLAPIVFLKFFGNGAVVLNIVVGGLACLVACVVGLLSLRRSRKTYVVSSENIQIG